MTVPAIDYSRICSGILEPVPEPEARSSDTRIRRRAPLVHRSGAPVVLVAHRDGSRAVDRVRLALRAYEQRAERRAAVLALWRAGFATRPAA
jgi:hypothetical protein